VGRIIGTVTDESGLAVPGAKVTLIQPTTGFSEQVLTSETGSYVFSSVAPGSYTITAEKAGFEKRQENGVVLDAASSRTVDLQMAVGSVAQTVTVTANEAEIKTDSGDVAGTIATRQITNIAMNGRNYFSLLNLLPGVTTSTTDPASVGVNLTGTYINGSRSPSTGVYIDGINNLSVDQNSYQLIVPNPDIIDQVKVNTASYTAEYGGNAGAMVIITSKSGSKQFHGSLFEYLRNNLTDAKSYLAQSKEPLHFNDFGATIGGPIFIPGRFNADKSKLFFFTSFEQKFYHYQTAAVSLIPTMLERQGNFSQSKVQPKDPTTGLPFLNAMVPQNRWSYNGPLLLAPFPQTNSTSAAGNYVRNPLTATDPLQETAKVDYLLSEKTRISGTAARESWFTFNNGGALGLTPNTNGGGSQPGWIAGINVTTTFSPTFLNYASVNAAAEHFVNNRPTATMSRSALGITFPELSPASLNIYNTAPTLTLSGYTSYRLGDPGAGKGQSSYDFHDDVTLVRGAHVLKAGAEFLRARDNENGCGCGNTNGNVTFNTSAAQSTGNVIADALLGNFYQYTQDEYGFFSWIRYSLYEFYAQDSWTINKHLHLDYGVRWSLDTPPYSPVGNESIFLPSLYTPANAVTVSPTTGTITPNSGNVYNGLALLGSGPGDYPYQNRIPTIAGSLSQYSTLFHGLPKGIWTMPKGDLAPRIGFAYSPFSKGTLAIRGGFGMFYDRPAANIYLLNMADNPPIDYSYSVFNGSIDNPGAAAGAIYPSALTTVGPSNFKTPSMMTFNLDVQQQLPSKIILDIGYVGTLARHLSRAVNINQLPVGTLYLPQNKGANANALRPYSGFGNITDFQYSDNSNYHGLQMSVNRRTASGLAFGSSFTFSKALSDLGVQTGYQPTTVQNPYNIRADYGPSDVNRKFVFSLNAQDELPFAKNAKNVIYRELASGWTISPVFYAATGIPVSIVVTPDIAGVGTAGSRASLVAGANPYLSKRQRNPSQWFNTAAFVPSSQMTQGQFGNTGRDFLKGPGTSEWDLAIFKHFKIRETTDLEFRAESFNLPNHASFVTLGTTVGASTFGAVTGTTNPRIMQFALKAHF